MLLVEEQSFAILNQIFAGVDPSVERQAMELPSARIAGLWTKLADKVNSPGEITSLSIYIYIYIYIYISYFGSHAFFITSPLIHL